VSVCALAAPELLRRAAMMLDAEARQMHEAYAEDDDQVRYRPALVSIEKYRATAKDLRACAEQVIHVERIQALADDGRTVGIRVLVGA